MTFLSTETCGTCEEREAELRRLRAACESMAEQLERAEATPHGLGATLPGEPLDAAAKQIPSLRVKLRLRPERTAEIRALAREYDVTASAVVDAAMAVALRSGDLVTVLSLAALASGGRE